MSWMRVVVMGVVQGFTEFLPVSSSGHLVLAGRLLGVKPSGVALEVVLHLGTLAAAIIFYRRKWARIVCRLREAESLRTIGFLVVATIPVAAAGFFLHDQLEKVFHSTRLVCVDLTACGLFLIIAGRAGEGKAGIGWARAIVMGCAQAVAILPGVSRSGMTVGTGLLSGVKREKAVEFSFMMAVPAIIGAAMAELPGGVGEPVAWRPELLCAGAAAAFMSGYFAIGLLLKLVVRGKLSYFGYYCILIGLAGLLWG